MNDEDVFCPLFTEVEIAVRQDGTAVITYEGPGYRAIWGESLLESW